MCQKMSIEMWLNYPQQHFRNRISMVTRTFALVLFAAVIIGVLSDAAATTYNNRTVNDDLNAKLYNYQCFSDKDNSNFSQNLLQIGLQVTSWPSHQLLTRIFAIFLRDVLNYQRVYLLPIEFTVDPDDDRYEQQKFSHTMNLIAKHPRYSNISMMNVGVWTSSISHAFVPIDVHEAGISTFPGRFGWFASPMRHNSSDNYLHYSVFLNRSHPLYEQYVMEDYQLNLLLQGTDHVHYKSPLCTNISTQCATLLAENKNETFFAIYQIKEMKAYLNILWLGSRFRSELDRLNTHYTWGKLDKRLLILHWTPSDVIDSMNMIEPIQQPLCEELGSLEKSTCKYELTPIIKYYSRDLLKDSRLIQALRYFWIDIPQLKELFHELNNGRAEGGGHATEATYDSLACKWLRNRPSIYRSWISNKPTSFSIGGIFPIKENTRGHQNLVKAVRSAVEAINESQTVLNNYNFRVLENDGECKADIVMKSFFHFFNDPEVVGVLGPACSETLEPVAGISRHINMPVMSYSAEGASFFDRKAYPFFFRTIGSNRQYEDIFVSLMKEFGWKRVAALTEDGQKYTEYISHMESTLKNNNLELIMNKKFLSDVSHPEMNKYLRDLKQKHAKIIIADIHNKYAAMALCEAFKLEMTAYQGYVWFLPSWLSKDWKSLVIETNNSCSSEQLEKAFEGHFSIMYSPFGNNDTIMEENKTIKEWIDWYSANVTDVSMYTAFAYDAVWVYAMAVDRILRENKDAVGNFRSTAVVNRLVDIIWETDFEGLSGRVRFGEGGSRITELVVTQWRNKQSVEVGKFVPRLVGSGRNLRTNGGDLILNSTPIAWFSEASPPGDGTFDCSFSSLAEFLNTECENATVVFTAIVCLIAVVVISLVSFLFWKQRYDKKLKRSAKIMKNFGIDLLSPSRSNVNTLDKWEVPKENVVVNRRLGEGAFGTVYGGEAQIGSEGWTAVAVKTLKTGASTEDRLDFLSEAEAMKRFDHKNIVKLLGVCLQSEPIYTIMEFMLYGDLKTYLLARRHMVNEKIGDESDISSKRLTMYAMDVARGIAYLAQQKYVHRDIACRNCLVNAQRVVKLGDFGMARPTYESDYYRFNRKGMLPVRWMAPEALALGMFTPASDVWAFGVVLFEIITFGSFPYQGLTNNQVLEYVKSGNTLQIPIGIKPQLEGLIKACWNRDSKKRPTASEIFEYISKYPSLLSPCLDFPSASVEMAETESDELELLPRARRYSPQNNDSGLDIVAQTSFADTIDRFNNIVNEGTADDPINIELADHIGCDSPEPLGTVSPMTPDGYSIMSPLLNHPTSELHQQTPF